MFSKWSGYLSTPNGLCARLLGVLVDDVVGVLPAIVRRPPCNSRSAVCCEALWFRQQLGDATSGIALALAGRYYYAFAYVAGPEGGLNGILGYAKELSPEAFSYDYAPMMAGIVVTFFVECRSRISHAWPIFWN